MLFKPKKKRTREEKKKSLSRRWHVEPKDISRPVIIRMLFSQVSATETIFILGFTSSNTWLIY